MAQSARSLVRTSALVILAGLFILSLVAVLGPAAPASATADQQGDVECSVGATLAGVEIRVENAPDGTKLRRVDGGVETRVVRVAGDVTVVDPGPFVNETVQHILRQDGVKIAVCGRTQVTPTACAGIDCDHGQPQPPVGGPKCIAANRDGAPRIWVDDAPSGSKLQRVIDGNRTLVVSGLTGEYALNDDVPESGTSVDYKLRKDGTTIARCGSIVVPNTTSTTADVSCSVGATVDGPGVQIRNAPEGTKLRRVLGGIETSLVREIVGDLDFVDEDLLPAGIVEYLLRSEGDRIATCGTLVVGP